jgi:hypothetical protein
VGERGGGRDAYVHVAFGTVVHAGHIVAGVAAVVHMGVVHVGVVHCGCGVRKVAGENR